MPKTKITLPLLPLRDVVVFPGTLIPLFVGRAKSVNALKAAFDQKVEIVLVSQIDASKDEPKQDDMYKMGVKAKILQLLNMSDGTVKALVEGQERCKILDIKLQNLHEKENDDKYKFLECEIQVEPTKIPRDKTKLEAAKRILLSNFENFIKQSKKIESKGVQFITSMEDASKIADTIAAQLPLSIEKKQNLLECLDLQKRLEKLASIIVEEMHLMEVEKIIQTRVRQQIEKSQKDFYLNEQVKAIQRELGENDEIGEINQLEEKINKAGMSKEAREKAISELKKLKMAPAMSAESAVIRNYLETLIDLPWKKTTRINKNLDQAQKILDADHFGLEKVKDRIIEYLAVQSRVDKLKSPIICLVGPPGVGKTSLGASIAKATNRKCVRISLGGVDDESEIRGHRKTYVGAMPGKIIQNLIKSKVKNPLIILDEIDKMGRDYRGDPASALLEVLDPEQNHTFVDHYIEVEFDLSEVMFIATANSTNIPPALIDRMEVVRLSGYTEEEKLNIAKKYLLPKEIKDNGVKPREFSISDEAITDIIRYYTRESGVRSLDREIAKICRKIVKQKQSNQSQENSKKITVKPSNLSDYLGVRKYDFGRAHTQNQIGQVAGLAWTESGGDLLTIEAVAVGGKGKITHTGQLGNVMQESVTAAMSVVRARTEKLGIYDKFHEDKDIHVHFPEGAVPKDGPSAGIGITTAMVSALTKIPVNSDVAMTGEITLRGEVLPIGGLREKLLAAQRAGIKKVLIPDGNKKDLSEIPANVVESLDIKPVKSIDEVLEIALERKPTESGTIRRRGVL